MKKRILAADNNIVFSESIKIFFKERGYSIAVCTEADMVLSKILDFKPDVILLDLKMGNTSGLDILKEIRSKDKNIKVVILTGSIDSKKISAAQSLGADEYMIKPVSMAELKEVIDRL